MNFVEMRVLLTGATGGIGSAIAEALLLRGAAVLSTGRDVAALDVLSRRFVRFGTRAAFIAADLLRADDLKRLAAAALEANAGAGINMLINNAGIGHFGLFESTADVDIERLLAVNVTAPLKLTRSLLPQLRRQSSAAIVNIGSVLGTIGYPGQATYSATKFAVRGFSEALRRELADTAVRVLYVAPRSTRTPLNSVAVDRLNAALRVATDSPAVVASAVCRSLARNQKASVLGWPERLYARLNAVAPSVVDRSLGANLAVIKAHAVADRARVASCEPDPVVRSA